VQEGCAELILQLDDGFQRLLAHGVAEFHGLASASRDGSGQAPAAPEPAAQAPAAQEPVAQEPAAQEPAGAYVHPEGDCAREPGAASSGSAEAEDGGLSSAAERGGPEPGGARLTVLRQRPGAGLVRGRVDTAGDGLKPGDRVGPLPAGKGPAITCADIVYALGEHPAGMTPGVLRAYVAAHVHDDRSSQASSVLV
jgi:hypothetical protein